MIVGLLGGVVGPVLHSRLVFVGGLCQMEYCNFGCCECIDELSDSVLRFWWPCDRVGARPSPGILRHFLIQRHRPGTFLIQQALGAC